MYLTLDLSAPPAFANGGFVPTKDWTSTTDEWIDGGGDAFNGWGFFKVDGALIQLPNGVMNTADGTLVTHNVPSTFGVGLYRVVSGFAAQGIHILSVVFPPEVPAGIFEWSGQLGSIGSTQKGIVSFDTVVGSNTYRLFTGWSNDGALDAGGTKPQITRTLIPMLASQSLVGAPQAFTTGWPTISTENSTSVALTGGFTLVTQWGQATLAETQAWIAGLLQEEASIPATDEVVPMTYSETLNPLTKVWWARSPVVTHVHVAPGDNSMISRLYISGPGRIAGDVKIKGTPDAPVRRRVRLVREIDATCVAEQWSDPISGAYEFRGFDPTQRYTVLAYDELGGYRAAIASNVVPEPMTV